MGWWEVCEAAGSDAVAAEVERFGGRVPGVLELGLPARQLVVRREVAGELLGCGGRRLGADLVRRMAQRGELVEVPVGRRARRVTVASLGRYLASQGVVGEEPVAVVLAPTAQLLTRADVGAVLGGGIGVDLVGDLVAALPPAPALRQVTLGERGVRVTWASLVEFVSRWEARVVGERAVVRRLERVS